ncbi:hypothetical protein HCU74_19610 [Spongiibacter sp. KMU-166]|uniref:Acyl-protein synthetase LuxE domain-containing protein n=1 Tax=Spongiibacter thalassae TaxID=2721624 RepID=A0ABX1GK42_9GAMM|nr:hypothetical protein [Spongiibacter thalassae]NKI19619.1 hypothetical protein [Spongiibacter thalassae]
MTHSSIKLSKTDDVIFSENIFDLSLEQQDMITNELSSDTVTSMLERCPQYEKFYSSFGNLREGVSHCPKIPTTTFKLADIKSSDCGVIEKWCLSSGTSGLQSRIPRNRLTLDRLLGSVRSSLQLLREWHEHELKIIHLGPDNESAGDVWFPFVMGLTELLYPTASVMDSSGAIHLSTAIEEINDALATTNLHVGIIGPPFAFLQLCKFAHQNNIVIKGLDRITTVTGGGWKRLSGDMIPQVQFREMICHYLGLNSVSQVRDAFNQVELNTLIIECEHHRKHVPPWLYVQTLSPSDLQPLGDNQLGLLGYIDSSCDSYPGIIISDDIGIVSRGRCDCGRYGVFMEIVRRVERGFQGGCALALDRPRVTEGEIRFV